MRENEEQIVNKRRGMRQSMRIVNGGESYALVQFKFVI